MARLNYSSARRHEDEEEEENRRKKEIKHDTQRRGGIKEGRERENKSRWDH